MIEIKSVDKLDHYGQLVIKAVDKYLDTCHCDTGSLLINIRFHRELTHQLGLEPYAEISRRGVALRAVHDEP